MKVNFLGVEELLRMVDGLSAEEKEELAGQLFGKLSAEAKARVMGIADSGLTVVTGSFVSLNADIAINIQNSGTNGVNADQVESILKALIELRKKKE
jgi:hypothetical protein